MCTRYQCFTCCNLGVRPQLWCSERGWLAAEPELGRDGPERGDHERDVLVEVGADLGGALDDLLAVYAAGEARLLQLLADGAGLERRDPVGPDEPAGVHEARHLVAGEEGVLEARLAHDARVAAVRLDRAHEPLRVAALAQHGRAVLGVLVERWVPLVVEVVQERHVAPGLLVLPPFAGIGPYRRLDGKAVPEKRLARRPLGEKLPCGVAVDERGAS